MPSDMAIIAAALASGMAQGRQARREGQREETMFKIQALQQQQQFQSTLKELDLRHDEIMRDYQLRGQELTETSRHNAAVEAYNQQSAEETKKYNTAMLNATTQAAKDAAQRDHDQNLQVLRRIDEEMIRTGIASEDAKAERERLRIRIERQNQIRDDVLSGKITLQPGQTFGPEGLTATGPPLVDPMTQQIMGMIQREGGQQKPSAGAKESLNLGAGAGGGFGGLQLQGATIGGGAPQISFGLGPQALPGGGYAVGEKVYFPPAERPAAAGVQNLAAALQQFPPTPEGQAAADQYVQNVLNGRLPWPGTQMPAPQAPYITEPPVWAQQAAAAGSSVTFGARGGGGINPPAAVEPKVGGVGPTMQNVIDSATKIATDALYLSPGDAWDDPGVLTAIRAVVATLNNEKDREAVKFALFGSDRSRIRPKKNDFGGTIDIQARINELSGGVPPVNTTYPSSPGASTTTRETRRGQGRTGVGS